MAEVDYVIPGIVVEKKGIVNISDIYSLMKEELEKRGYVIIEKIYSDEVDDKHKLAIKWAAEKEVDDYTQYVIEIGLKGKVKEIKQKTKINYEGVVTIKFEAYLKKDYEDKWESTPTFKIMRGFYDKFTLKKKFNKYSKELRDEVYDLYYEIKSYLGLIKTKDD